MADPTKMYKGDWVDKTQGTPPLTEGTPPLTDPAAMTALVRLFGTRS